MRIMSEIPGANVVPITKEYITGLYAAANGYNLDEAQKRVLSCFIYGEAPREEDESIAADIAIEYAINCKERGKKRLARRAKIPSDDIRRRRLMDVVMSRAFSAEPLAVSVARVAKAVAVIGFDVCTAFTATCAYNIFPELETEELKVNGKRRRERGKARSA